MNGHTIVTPWGAYRFRRLAMGLRNSAQSFQCLMSTVLESLPSVFVYLEDILVFDQDQRSHIKSLAEVFRRLSVMCLKINLPKCDFGKPSVEFLGLGQTSSFGVSGDLS